MEARPWKKSAKELKSNLSSSSSSCAISNLPDPILMEILCRMSIKTLTICKSVCKSWLDLIKDPHFCQMHQRRSRTEVFLQPYQDAKGNTLKLHLGNFNFPNNLDPCHFELPKFSVSPYNVPNYDVDGGFFFANSCNGLLCYYGNCPNYRFAVVWNPCTSEFITFPPPPLPCRGYRLGFSRKENKFKLLRLMSADMVVLADVCTIEKLCSWKIVGPCSSHARVREYSNKVGDMHAVFLRGTLHWVGTDSRRPSCIAIHTFDFEDDHFGTLPLPPCFDETYSYAIHEDMLGVFEGRLFVIDYRNGGVTTWLMTEYGVQGSWKKLFVSNEELEYPYWRPVACMGNAEMLMACTDSSFSGVYAYNLDLQSVRGIGCSPVSLRVIAFNPSLVLLKDSMLGYDVHVKPKCPGLKQGEISTTPSWWSAMLDNQESSQPHGSKAPLVDDELSYARVGEENVSATSESSASKESSTRTAGLSRGHIRDIKGNDKATSVHELGELAQGVTLDEADKSGLALMLEIEKLKHRDKELEHRGKELEHRDKELQQRDKELEYHYKILDQRDNLLNILQELDNTNQSRMTVGELTCHLNKIKQYENLVAHTFNQ